MIVAILILLELTLQYIQVLFLKGVIKCRNPYFIGINSAIEGYVEIPDDVEEVAILILLELTLQ